MVAARVEPCDDGEYQLVCEFEIFDDTRWATVADGIRLFWDEAEDGLPFDKEGDEPDTGEFELDVDPVNFESYLAEGAFVEEVRQACDVEFANKDLFRKSLIPDPEVVIKLTQTLAGYLLAKPVLDKVIAELGDVVAKDIAAFYAFAKTIVTKYAKYALPKNRPITYIFVASGQPTLEFVARTSDPNFVLSALLFDKLRHAASSAQYFDETLKAVKIQFVLYDDGEWKFNYLLTATGGVIGTEIAYTRRSHTVELLLSKAARDREEEGCQGTVPERSSLPNARSKGSG